MKLARFWTRERGEATGADGNRISAVARGWSNESIQAAQAVAREIARRVAARLASGDTQSHRYPYGDRPLPEPVLREFTDRNGVNAAVTRNAYGALVLNTRDLMFVDIDRAEEPGAGSGLVSGLRSLFGKPTAAKAADPTVTYVQEVAQTHGLAARVYKTAAGYRVLIPNQRFEAGSAGSEQLMTQFGADPLYIRLCGMQQSFRARLSPKPWRCGMSAPPVQFPFLTAEEESAFKAWEAKYNSSAAAFATCRYITSTEGAAGDSTAEELIRYHDQETKAVSGLPLA
jgi:hypothetical protein